MKLIISPSKTYQINKEEIQDDKSPIYIEKTNYLLSILASQSKDQIAQMMKLKGNLLDQTYSLYQDRNEISVNEAIKTYTGMVFKGLTLDHYNSEQIDYLHNHLLILSALYGVLRPDDLIKPYRLDFTMNFPINLYDYWQEDVTNVIKDELIINLASQEYSALIKKPMINIDFLQKRGNAYKNVSTYSKQARGIMLDYLIRNQVSDLNQLKQFDCAGYTIHEDLSNDQSLVFTREQK